VEWVGGAGGRREWEECTRGVYMRGEGGRSVYERSVYKRSVWEEWVRGVGMRGVGERSV
jgi:hypothetical protein